MYPASANHLAVVVLMVAMLLASTPPATATARRLLAADAAGQGACARHCVAIFEVNMEGCITNSQQAASYGRVMTGSPYDTSVGRAYAYTQLQLIEDECLAIHAPGLDRCRVACHPVISAVNDWAGHVHDKAKQLWEALTNPPADDDDGGAVGGGSTGSANAPVSTDVPKRVSTTEPVPGCGDDCGEA